MQQHLLILCIFVVSALHLGAESSSLLIREEAVTGILNELPMAIKLQVSVEKAKESGLFSQAVNARAEPAIFLKYYKCSDGIEFLIDDTRMALWYRPDEHSTWVCILLDVHVNKTFGGAFPYLAVQYVGSERFVYAESLYLGTHQPDTAGTTSPTDYRRFPSFAPYAYCATYLVDASNGELLDKTEKYEYDQNPNVMIPASWASKHKLPKAKIERLNR